MNIGTLGGLDLDPGMLTQIMQLLQSGQWGTTQGFQQLLGGPSPTSGPDGFTAGRNRYMREHRQADPFGWQDWLKGKDFDPYKGITDPVSVDMTDSLKEAKFTAATGLGYGMKGGMQQRRGDLGVVDRVNTANALQSLKQAGWDPSMGYGPQANLSDKMNQLLFSVSPKYDKSKIPEPVKDPKLSSVYDPFGGMQSAIARDAYVNDTLGGGFYGGVLPEQDDQSWTVQDWIRRGMGRGQMTDPHFATPQMGADGKPDLYAGWASNQAQQFGQLPYDLFGQQVNDINHPENQAAGFGAGNMVKNTAAPTWNGGDSTRGAVAAVVDLIGIPPGDRTPNSVFKLSLLAIPPLPHMRKH